MFINLGHLADSVAPRKKLVNVVAEVAISITRKHARALRRLNFTEYYFAKMQHPSRKFENIFWLLFRCLTLSQSAKFLFS
jgi:hypothetical protein